MNDGSVHQAGEFQLDRAKLFPVTNQLFHCFAVVAFFFHAFVRFNVCVANDPDQGLALDSVAGENLRCKVQDQFF